MKYLKITIHILNNRYGKLGLAGYGQSKLANILHANELARRLKV